MRWGERQVAMLREMGVRMWLPPADPGAPSAQVGAASSVGASHECSARRAGPGVAAPAALVAPAAPAAPGATALLDWPALREAVAGCIACPLCKARREPVFGAGHPRAHWMIVGDAPAESDDQAGEPFTARPGQLLDNMLRAVGLTRAAADAAQQVYVANAIKCFAPGSRPPRPEEIALCASFLARQVQLVQPRIILALGSVAAQSLLRSDAPLGRLRGRVHSYRGVPLVVTYHPTVLIRNPAEKAKAWDDLCLALETVRSAAA